jgi:toxin ParE1/3/4
MDFTVTIAKSALKDLEEIVKFIAHENPERAQEVGDKLIEKALGLNRFPDRHVLCPNRDNVRKFPVSPFIINKGKGRVTVLRFWHSARQNPML